MWQYVLILIFVVIFMVPLVTFLSYSHVLQKKSSLIVVLVLSLLLMIGGGVFGLIYKEPGFLAASVPLFFFLNYVVVTAVFKKIYKRAPVDTTYNWESGIFPDRVYSILVVGLGLVIPLLLLGMFL